MGMKKIRLKDKDFMQKLFASIKFPLADSTFAMRFIWAESLQHTWTIINDNLCFFGFLKNRYVLWGAPIGGNRLKETIRISFDAIEELNREAGIDARPIAIYFPEYIRDEYEAIGSEDGGDEYTFNYWTQDYVYNTQDLIDLKGSRFDSKRNKVNFFTKNYSNSVEEFDFSRHFDDCIKLIDIWNEQKKRVILDSSMFELETETIAAKKAIEFANELGLKGVVLTVDEKVAGISLGEPLNDDMCSNIIEKTNAALNGASEFIFREFAKYWSSHKFINAQDDFGVEYLKNVKLSYHPIKLLKSYCLEKR